MILINYNQINQALNCWICKIIIKKRKEGKIKTLSKLQIFIRC